MKVTVHSNQSNRTMKIMIFLLFLSNIILISARPLDANPDGKSVKDLSIK